MWPEATKYLLDDYLGLALTKEEEKYKQEFTKKLKAFYESIADNSEYVSQNVQILSTNNNHQLEIFYRAKNQMVYNIIIDFVEKEVGIISEKRFKALSSRNETLPPLSNEELKFYDSNGFELSVLFNKLTGQEITDWFGRE